MFLIIPCPGKSQQTLNHPKPYAEKPGPNTLHNSYNKPNKHQPLTLCTPYPYEPIPKTLNPKIPGSSKGHPECPQEVVAKAFYPGSSKTRPLPIIENGCVHIYICICLVQGSKQTPT